MFNFKYTNSFVFTEYNCQTKYRNVTKNIFEKLKF